MNSNLKAAFGALILASAALGLSACASGPGTSYSYGVGVSSSGYSDPCYGPRYRRPNYCGQPRYSGSVFIGGSWYDGPFHYRDRRGQREYWHRGRWHRGRQG